MAWPDPEPDPDRTAAAESDSPWREALLALLSYGAVALWWLWPLPLVLADHAVEVPIGSEFTSADFDLITWALTWDVHALLTRPLGLWDANVFYPAASSLAFSEHFLGYVPLFAPTWIASGNPVLASNVLLFATYPLTGLATYALARRFVAAPGAWVAGFLFAFCGLRYFTLWHFHLLGAFGIPLALLFTERWLDRARASDAVLLALALTFQVLSSFYLAYALLLLYGPYLALAAWRWRARLDRRRVVGLSLVGLAVAVPLVATSLPYVRLRQEGWIPSYAAETSKLLRPRMTAYRIVEYLRYRSVGWAGYALGLTALVPPWRDARHIRSIAVLAVAVGLLFAAGPVLLLGGVAIPSPYQLLMDFVPGFNAVRMPRRFLVCAQLGLALLAAIGLTRVLARLPTSWAWPTTGLAVGLVAIPLLGLPKLVAQPKPSPAATKAAYGVLARLGDGRPLLEIPIGSSEEAARRMVASTVHWLPTIDGYSGYPPPTRSFFARITRGLPHEGALQRLFDAVDIGWVIVHTDQLTSAGRERWHAFTPSGLEPIGAWDDHLLFRVTLPEREGVRDRLFSKTITPGGVPLEPLGAECPGRIEALTPPASVVAPGGRIRAILAIHNEGADTWPAFAVFPRRLVRVDASIHRGERTVGDPRTLWLDRDVPGGTRLRFPAELTMPRRPGEYTVEFSARQDDRDLAECGLRPLRTKVRVIAAKRLGS